MRDAQAYEKLVDRLAQKYENAILRTAISVIESIGTAPAEIAIDAASQEVFNELLDAPDWTSVEGADISGIARDAAERAWSQTRVWNEGA